MELAPSASVPGTPAVPAVSAAPAKTTTPATKAVEAPVVDTETAFVPPPVTINATEAAALYELFERLSPYVMYGARHVFDEIREKLGHSAE